MACLIVTLPREIQLSMFCFSEDLDDALSLSQTCRNLRGAYAAHQKIIERTIITSSHVYAFDFQLSYLLKLNEVTASHFDIPGGASLEDVKRWSFEALLAAIETDKSKDTVTDGDIDAVTLRWRQIGYLRDLYLDDILSKEFELFRALFAAKLPDQVRKMIVEPGLTRSSTSASRLKHSRQYSPGFKARFYKSLCVHSMAIAALQLTKIAPDSNEYPVRQLYESLVEDAFNAWTKHRITLGSRSIAAGSEVKLDCLEVFDFLYLFLLKKLLPFESLGAWKYGDANSWPVAQDGLAAGPGKTEEWYLLLEQCRWVLKPHDISDLIKHRVWRADTTFQWNRSTYLRARGIFQPNDLQRPEYYYMYTRILMVNQLLPKGYEKHIPTDKPCWWDRVRVACGSPFLPGAVPRFAAEISKYQKAQDLRASEPAFLSRDAETANVETQGEMTETVMT